MLEVIKDNIVLIIVGLLSLIEITPIKFSPLEYIGKKINKGLNDKMDNIDNKIDKNYQAECKILISDFVQDYLQGEKKTRSQWVAIINLANEYISKNWNSEVRADAAFLEDEYKKLFFEKGSK